MVYRPRRRFNRRRFRKGAARWRRAGAKAGGMAYKAWRLAKRLKDMVNVEYKYFDTTSNISPDYNGTLTTLNSITQGTTDISRVGDSVKIQNLVIRGYWSYASSSTVNCVVRMIVLWDPQNKTSSASDILENTGTGYSVFSPKKFDNRFQTRILYDRVHDLVPTADNAMSHFSRVIPVNLHTQFSAGSTTIQTGALKILVLSTNVTTNLPSLLYYSRVSFTDN